MAGFGKLFTGGVAWQYDAEANAAYLALTGGHKVHHSCPLADDPDFILDFDEIGRLLGVEILNARENLPYTAMFNTSAVGSGSISTSGVGGSLTVS